MPHTGVLVECCTKFFLYGVPSGAAASLPSQTRPLPQGSNGGSGGGGGGGGGTGGEAVCVRVRVCVCVCVCVEGSDAQQAAATCMACGCLRLQGCILFHSFAS